MTSGVANGRCQQSLLPVLFFVVVICGFSEDAPAKPRVIRYLPLAIGGVPVLLKESPNSWRVTNADLQSSSSGVSYSRSKNTEGQSPDEVASWGSLVHGIDEGDGWLRTETTEVSIEVAQRTMRKIGAELSLPGFQQDMSVLQYAFSEQSILPNPAGSLSSKIYVASESPYAVVIDDFMSHEECDFLRGLGINRLKPAMVVQDGDNWYDTQTQTRSNEQVWLTQGEEKSIPLLRHVLKRMHRTARVPDEYAEALQIGRYKQSQKYEGHIDSDPPHKVARPATLITYLADTEEGGDTLFPNGRRQCGTGFHKHPKTGEKLYGAAVCCQTPEDDPPGTVRVRPKKGRAVLFFSHLPHGEIDKKSTHVGCPVIRGEKWIAQRWFRYEPYNRVNYDRGKSWDPRFDGAPIEELRRTMRDEVYTRVMSQIKPKVFVEEHFLSDGEVSSMLELFKAQKVTEKDSVTLEASDIKQIELLHNLTARAFLVARWPYREDFELKLKRLPRNGFEIAQIDDDSDNNEPVAAKVAVYLATHSSGGELFFPDAKRAQRPDCNDDIEACCAASQLKMNPHKGDAVLIHSYGQDGNLDLSSRHGHCRLVEGEQWIAEWRFLFEPEPQDAPNAPKKDNEPDVTFENQRKTAVNIFWVPAHGGDEALMGDLAPGGKRKLKSFSGHIFHVRDAESGEVIEKFVVGASYPKAGARFIIPDRNEL